MFQLDTERLTIRSWAPADRAAFKEMMNDPEVTRYLRGGRPYAEDEVDEWFARQERQLSEFGFCMGAVIEKSSGSLVGISGMQPLGTTPDLEVGWIFRRDRWGRGYASEAGAAAIAHVLGPLGRSRVVAIIDVDNDPSKRVASRLGMHYEGRYTGEQLGHRKPEIVVDLFYRTRHDAAELKS